MAPGFLGSESFVAGSKWYLERTRLAFGGEDIARPNAYSMVYIPGFRCRDCRTLLLKYGPPPESTGGDRAATGAGGGSTTLP